MPLTTYDDRESNLQVVERLTAVVERLAHLGTPAQRDGRDRQGRFVAVPPSIDAQALLEQALFAAARRVSQREVSGNE